LGFWFSEDDFARLTLPECGDEYRKPGKDAGSRGLQNETNQEFEEDAIANQVMGLSRLESAGSYGEAGGR
jgi:hypothetical protein